jgi:hypothetical protein
MQTSGPCIFEKSARIVFNETGGWMPGKIDRRTAARAYKLLGVVPPPREIGAEYHARDEAALCLARDPVALCRLGLGAFVSLENLHEDGLLPSRIRNVVRNAKLFGRKPQDEFMFCDLAAASEADFSYFGERRTIGEHYKMVVREVQNIYLATGRFRFVPTTSSRSTEAISRVQQDALIERVAHAVRRDPNAGRMLFRLFPPSSPAA